MGVKLVVFDMDGVLVNIKSSWQYLHERLGSIVYVKDSMMGLNYFQRRVSYYEWVVHDVRAMLKARGGKVHRSEIESIFNEVEINPEALAVVPRLKELGIELAIISGGIDILAERVGKVLGIKRVLANGLAFNDEGYLIEGG
ncbi:MAG TPA: HAD family hydrolase, partial [Acidilobales archaeon]|nr:HAD family hydrolase [Acidilobales archaeon]